MKVRVCGISNHVSGAGWGFFVDMDTEGFKDPADDPARFRLFVRQQLEAFRLPFAWLFKTGAGYHLVAPFQADNMKAVRAFHMRFDEYGADDMHRLASLHYGRLILRVTPKPNEPNGVEYLTTRGALGRLASGALGRRWVR